MGNPCIIELLLSSSNHTYEKVNNITNNTTDVTHENTLCYSMLDNLQTRKDITTGCKKLLVVALDVLKQVACCAILSCTNYLNLITVITRI